MEHRPVREAGESMLGDLRKVRDVLIVDDHPLMCEALSMTLSAAFGLARVRTAASLAAAEASIRSEGAPDAVVLDLNLPDVQGIEGVISLRARAGEAPLTVISAEVDRKMVGSVIAAGARGYLDKAMPRAEMIAAFKTMWSGEIFVPESCDLEAQNPDETEVFQSFASLTPQQMKILRLICQGRPNKIISYELSISEATVKTHIAAIMSKIKVQNRTQAALMASRAGLFSR